MDLRGMANQASNVVNGNVIVILETSSGYTMGAGQRQQPAYNAGITGPAQIQALDGDTLKHLDKLNIQGFIRALYMKGNLAGVIRPDSKGGDRITIPPGRGVPALFIGTWFTVMVIETWSDWTKVAIRKQGGA